MAVKVEMETLYCEPGNHKWKRPAGKRGRKPTHCGDHLPVQIVRANSAGEKVQTLYCELGNHSWERPSARGVRPHNCPEHKPVQNQNVSRATNGKEQLHCTIGDHDWERTPTRGRKPANCPDHAALSALPDNLAPNEVLLSEYENGDAMVLILDEAFYQELPKVEAPKKGPGRPRLHETKEEQEQAALERSRDKVNHLENSLKERGTHLSQQAPYQLYKQSGDGYEFVRDFSPLAKAQFINAFTDRFDAGIYYFMRDGVRIEE